MIKSFNQQEGRVFPLPSCHTHEEKLLYQLFLSVDDVDSIGRIVYSAAKEVVDALHCRSNRLMMHLFYLCIYAKI